MRRRHVVATASVVLATAGAASAYLTGGGGGTATAATGHPVPVTLAPGSPVAPLRPGAAVDVLLLATNSGGAPTRLTSLALDTTAGTSGFTVDGAHTGCPTTSFWLASPSYDGGGDGWTVPAASGGTPGTLEIVLPQALTMELDAPNGCQGASVTVHLGAGP